MARGEALGSLLAGSEIIGGAGRHDDPPSRGAGTSPAVVREMPRTPAVLVTEIVRCVGSVPSTTVMSCPSSEFSTQEQGSRQAGPLQQFLTQRPRRRENLMRVGCTGGHPLGEPVHLQPVL